VWVAGVEGTLRNIPCETPPLPLFGEKNLKLTRKMASACLEVNVIPVNFGEGMIG